MGKSYWNIRKYTKIIWRNEKCLICRKLKVILHKHYKIKIKVKTKQSQKVKN